MFSKVQVESFSEKLFYGDYSLFQVLFKTAYSKFGQSTSKGAIWAQKIQNFEFPASLGGFLVLLTQDSKSPSKVAYRSYSPFFSDSPISGSTGNRPITMIIASRGRAAFGRRGEAKTTGRIETPYSKSMVGNPKIVSAATVSSGPDAKARFLTRKPP